MSTQGQGMELEKAQGMAERIVRELAPFCLEGMAAIAGSIRRRRPHVNDIDLVLCPRPGQLNGLRERVKRTAKPIIDGEVNLLVRLQNGVQLDIFLAQGPSSDLFEAKATNFGSLLLCRTGSKEHNIMLVERAKRLGLSWNPYHGVFGRCPRTGRTNVCLASATEEEIFRVLEMEYVEPERRESSFY